MEYFCSSSVDYSSSASAPHSADFAGLKDRNAAPQLLREADQTS